MKFSSDTQEKKIHRLEGMLVQLTENFRRAQKTIRSHEKVIKAYEKAIRRYEARLEPKKTAIIPDAIPVGSLKRDREEEDDDVGGGGSVGVYAGGGGGGGAAAADGVADVADYYGVQGEGEDFHAKEEFHVKKAATLVGLYEAGEAVERGAQA